MMDKNNMTQDNKPLALDDEQRVKVLSPGMLVLKRFFRNRLAVIGLSIITFMALFSFLGGLLMPYTQQQTFYSYEKVSQEFAGVTVNDNYLYTVREGESFPPAVQPFFIRALTNGESSFTVDGTTYFLEQAGVEDYLISYTEPLGSGLMAGSSVRFNPAEGVTAAPELIEAMGAAIAEGEDSFELDGESYYLSRAGKTYQLGTGRLVAMASKMVFDMANPGDNASFAFKSGAERALGAGASEFEADGLRYLLKNVEADSADIMAIEGGQELVYARMSRFLVKATANDIFLTLGFKAVVQDAVEANQQFFDYADPGEESASYELVRKDTQYLIRRTVDSKLLLEYDLPSPVHWVGTDDHGMDILTRLMYGGRISLTVGIVVVLLEVLIGVALGGMAGYFGGKIDNLLMRLVDIINCLPYLPLMIIIGAVMDGMRVNPMYRIYVMMGVMGILGWPSTARMVRGQILSLREQEFMIAAEASGLSSTRRIFKHLVPNVIPQLVVIATMGLGSVILTESTLSFLGLGVKYPMASWGNIISSVSNVFVMANYWFAWIPAGMLILLTVLGFNFIGDGLRDAFDPKMKR